MESIVDVFKDQADRRGAHPFISEGDRTLSYAEAFAEAARMAHVLRAQGVRPGDRVILLLDSRARHMLTYLASIAIGAIPVHLNTQRPRRFVEFAIENTGARLVVTHNYAEDWPGMPVPVIPFPDFTGDEPQLWTDERDAIAYMMYTSGTTGTPKAVMTSQANTLFTARTIIDFAQLTEHERELIALPLSFTFGLGHLHAQILLGGQARLVPSMRDTEALLAMMAGDGITGFLASPGMIKSLVEDHTEAFVRSAANLRYIVINCTPMPVPLTERLLALLPGTRHYMYYGLTEASRSAFNHYNANPTKIGCTGRATKGVQLRIDAPAPGTGEGEICMKGPNIMPGYWGDAGSSGIDADGWFHSGDLGVMDDDGFITVRGRMTDQISIDGIKCQPLEVEQVLNLHPDVAESAVVGLSDERTFQTVAAGVVLRAGANQERAIAGLVEYCRVNLEPQKLPTRYIILPAVPRTDLGKIVRSEVRAAFESDDAAVWLASAAAAAVPHEALAGEDAQ